MLQIGDVMFPNRLFCAVGARNMGKGYPFHHDPRLPWHYLMDWRGTNLALKTFTWEKNVGKMILSELDGVTPVDLFPRCIWANLWTGDVLNNVKLSNPGLPALMELLMGIDENFMMSAMTIGTTPEARQSEWGNILQLLAEERNNFRSKFVLQSNEGCPNSGHDLEQYWTETETRLEIAGSYGIKIMLNYSPIAPLDLMLRTGNHPACLGLWVGNTIPWGNPAIDWVARFGTDVSPLVTRGFQPGGYSGSLATPITEQKIADLRAAGYSRTIVAGNSIRTRRDVRKLGKYADGLSYGTGAIVRPQYMGAVKAAANRGT